MSPKPYLNPDPDKRDDEPPRENSEESKWTKQVKDWSVNLMKIVPGKRLVLFFHLFIFVGDNAERLELQESPFYAQDAEGPVDEKPFYQPM